MSRLWSNAPNLPHPSEAIQGETYDPKRDYARLSGQLARVHALMKDGEWRTLATIAHLIAAPSSVYALTGGSRGSPTDSEAAISARLRDLRKSAYGGHTVERRSEGGGLFSYRLIVKGRKAA